MLYDSLALHAATPLACDPDNAGLTLPEGFCALVAADGLGTARHAVVAPNGDLYVALQSGKGKTGGVVALRDENGDGRFETKEYFGDGSSTGIALRNGYLYVAKVESVERWKMTPGQLKPAGRRRSSSRICRRNMSITTRASRSTARARCTSISALPPMPASRRIGRKALWARIRVRCWRRMAASGNLTKTSCTRKKRMARNL